MTRHTQLAGSLAALERELSVVASSIRHRPVEATVWERAHEVQLAQEVEQAEAALGAAMARAEEGRRVMRAALMRRQAIRDRQQAEYRARVAALERDIIALRRAIRTAADTSVALGAS